MNSPTPFGTELRGTVPALLLVSAWDSAVKYAPFLFISAEFCDLALLPVTEAAFFSLSNVTALIFMGVQEIMSPLLMGDKAETKTELLVLSDMRGSRCSCDEAPL